MPTFPTEINFCDHNFVIMLFLSTNLFKDYFEVDMKTLVVPSYWHFIKYLLNVLAYYSQSFHRNLNNWHKLLTCPKWVKICKNFVFVRFHENICHWYNLNPRCWSMYCHYWTMIFHVHILKKSMTCSITLLVLESIGAGPLIHYGVSNRWFLIPEQPQFCVFEVATKK